MKERRPNKRWQNTGLNVVRRFALRRYGGLCVILPTPIRFLPPGWPIGTRGFPRYVRVHIRRAALTVREILPFVAFYYPAPDTFVSTAVADDMLYRQSEDSRYRILITRLKNRVGWQVRKFRGDRLLNGVDTPTPSYILAMLELAKFGVELDEPALTFALPEKFFWVEHEAQQAMESAADMDEGEELMGGTTIDRQSLVYGVINRGSGDLNLVFIPEFEAFRLSSIHRAIETARTWEDFQGSVSPDDWCEVVRCWREDWEEGEEYPVPQSTEKFDTQLLPGFCDGDWPDWPEQKMLEQWIPEDVQEQYGRRENSVINGYFLVLDVKRTTEIVAALEEKGFRRDDAFVRLACGESRLEGEAA
jgi:hypothetical protein